MNGYTPDQRRSARPRTARSLVPGLGDDFVIKKRTGFSLRFQEDANGQVASALYNRPQGPLTLTKKK